MIHIVTVYDSLNYGSYFQAMALKNYLCKFDNVDYLDIHHQNLRKDTIRLVMRNFKHFQFKAAYGVLCKYVVFKNAHKNFAVTNIHNVSENDIFVFGSDEIWNLNRDKMRRSKEFFGAGIPGHNKIAYAPSINTTCIDTFRNYDYCKIELDKFVAISVRDSRSKVVIEELTGREVPLLVDPTLLMEMNFYSKRMSKTKLDYPFLLIYSYGSLMKISGVQEKIIAFARKERVRIVSLGQNFTFCDSNIMATPKEFLKYVSMAKYIITDTFHGSIFSIIFQKNFLAYDVSNYKVNALLSDYNLSNRMVNKDADLDNKFSHAPDFSDCNLIWNKRKLESEQFIENAINIIKTENTDD